MAELYLKTIQEQWGNISRLYNEFAEERPVMMLDVGAGEVHAFAYDRLVELLDVESQTGLTVQYQRALDRREMVLFVRDPERKQLLSYTLKLEDEAPSSLEEDAT